MLAQAAWMFERYVEFQELGCKIAVSGPGGR
jgi:hypothetical protein